MRRALAVALVLGLGTQAAAAPDAPGSAKVSASDLAKARDHFRRGHDFHEQGRYDDAAREYEAAFALAQLPELLYNLGQVHRLRGDKPAALANYRRYLELAPTGRGADKARQFVGELAVDLEQESALGSRTLDDTTRGAVEGVAAAAPAPKPLPLSVVPRRAPGLDGGEPPADRGRTLRIAGLATGGGGVLLLGGAGLFALRGSSLKKDQDGVTRYEPGLVDDGKAANRNALLLGIAGGAALVTGGVLYYLGVRRRSEPRVVALPMPGTDGAGVMVWATY